MPINHTLSAALAPIAFGDPVLMRDTLAHNLLGRVMEASRQPFSAQTAILAASESSSSPVPAGDIAVIGLNGILTKTPSPWDDFLGLVPCESVIDAIHAAEKDTGISAIAFDIDSPGGFVNGSVELADTVASCSKRTIGIIRGLCCSGAYYIASQCDRIIGRRESEIGNIGVYSVLMDASEYYAALGIAFTLVATGPFKGLGADGKVSDVYVSDTRRIVTGIFEQFVQAVASGRGMSVEDVRAVADGRAFLGPDAMKLGLIDELASTFDEAITAASGAAAPSKRKTSMANATQSGAAVPPATPQAAAADDKGNEPSESDTMKNTLSKTIESSGKHRDQARKAMDACNDMSDDPDDDMKSLASKAAKSLKSASDESLRCAKMCCTMAGESEEDPDDEPAGDPSDPTQAGGIAPVAFTHQQYTAAFGDAGAKMFLDKKPFAAAAAEYIGKLKTEHEARVKVLTDENAKLKTQLGAIDRGNPSASFDAGDDNKAAGSPAVKGRANVSENLARYQAHIQEKLGRRNRGPVAAAVK